MKTETAWEIPLFRIYCDEDDVKAVTESIRAGMGWATGPNTRRMRDFLLSSENGLRKTTESTEDTEKNNNSLCPAFAAAAQIADRVLCG